MPERTNRLSKPATNGNGKVEIATSDSSIRGESKGAYALHKQHAVVHTASIDVKIMRLDRKQVTLSVFRQMREKSIVVETDSTDNPIQVVGVPWGLVNYTWEKSPPWADHYLVWQGEDELGDPVLYRMPLPLVSRLRHRYEMEPERVYGCRSCDGSRHAYMASKNYDTQTRCHSCQRKLGWFPLKFDEARGCGLARWIFGYWEADDFKQDCKDEVQIVEKLRWFEQLDQLFIAV